MTDNATATWRTSASERDVLLATKLYVPGLRPGLVPRARLSEQLEQALGRGVVLVVAPAGYGKTVLLADWVRVDKRPAAWLSLDVGDNDPARFWRHAVAALEGGYPGIGARLNPLLGPPAPLSFESLVTGLINQIVADPDERDAVLVLDDYHVVDSAAVHQSLGFLLEHRPSALRLVIASRSDPPLALARLRGRGELGEVRAADLRFTSGEAGELLRHAGSAAGQPLPEATVAALAARTEGWAAGLQLAALSLRDQSDVDRFMAGFTGSHRYVLDYLAEEVLERQSEATRRFLLETSVLERLSGPLCDAVTGRTDSQALLQQVEQAGLFLVPLDDVRGWWRYHQLFADLLRARLEQQPGGAAARHGNAAAWYEERGLPDDALRHALAAGEMNWAARLAEQNFDTVYNLQGEAATIERWLSALPDELSRSRPRLLLARSQMAAMRGDVDAMEPLIGAAEHAYTEADDEPFEPTAGRASSMLINIPAHIALQRGYIAQLRGDAEGTARFSSQALAELNEGEWVLSSAIQGFLAVAEWLRGRLGEAEGAFASSITGWRKTGQLTMSVWGGYSLAHLQRAQGRLDAAMRTCQEALEFTGGPTGSPPAAAGPAFVGLAEVAYQHNDLDRALRDVTEGITLCRQFVYTPPLTTGLATLAWIRQATDDPTGALDAMDEADRLYPGPPGLLNPIPAERARLLLAQGDLDGAARWTEAAGLDADDEPCYPREPGHLMLARVLLSQDRPSQALALLDRLHAAAATQQRIGSVIEVQALRALARAASGDEAGGADVLVEALKLGCPRGYVRVFADEGPPMAELLARLIGTQRAERTGSPIPFDYLARLQRAFQAAPVPGPAEPERAAPILAPGLVEQLTGREIEVLTMLAGGRSNRAIATQLVVSVDTVKKHVSHVLEKLGATNRTEAVARARELHLIP